MLDLGMLEDGEENAPGLTIFVGHGPGAPGDGRCHARATALPTGLCELRLEVGGNGGQIEIGPKGGAAMPIPAATEATTEALLSTVGRLQRRDELFMGVLVAAPGALRRVGWCGIEREVDLGERALLRIQRDRH